MNDLIVNTSKTVAMSFYLCPSNPPCKPRIVLFNTDITYKSEVKILGMYITDNLSWKVHIRTLCHSLSKVYFIIKSLKDVLGTNMLWNIYFAYFESRLRYGIIFWGGTGESIKVLRMQKKKGDQTNHWCEQT